MELLSTQLKDNVLSAVKKYLDLNRDAILMANKRDLDIWSIDDQAMYDRLVINDQKLADMIKAVEDIIADRDPVGVERYRYDHPNGMKVVDRTAPFGTVMIIYESRPDVTIEAAMIAFKSNNRILLKGGKEAKFSNRVLVDCWHKALAEHELSKDWITLLEFDRQQTQAFLRSPTMAIDLIVPRGGEGLISFVKTHATCPVLISGRGNNFLYVHKDADWEKVISIVINAKTDKISACNALDKVLINRELSGFNEKKSMLISILEDHQVEVITEDLTDEWPKEYLAMRLALGSVGDMESAITLINQYSGGHSAVILTEDKEIAERFMNEVDAAAVYQNASSRFTDGGAMGLGAELAISTDKLHHRGPLGLHHLVTNKWYVYGEGQIR